MKTFLMGSAAALLLAGTALADSEWDMNADGMIDREEFRAGIGENAYGEWDTNADGMLSRAEYEAGIAAQDDADTYGAWDDHYGGWDADQDEMLTRDEYEEGLWTTFDADEDDLLNEHESAAWQEDDLRYDATRSGREVSK
jgi:hypothetical protein